MSNIYLFTRSNVPGKVPTISQLQAGAAAMNTADAKMFFSTGSEVIELANASSVAEVYDIFSLTTEPTGFVDRTASVISFDNATRTFKIEPLITSYSVYFKGVKFEKSSAETIQIANVSGTWFIYFNDLGGLVASQSVWSIPNTIPIAELYWSSVDQRIIILAEERHGCTMDSSTHEYLHLTKGTAYAKGLSLSGYTTNGDGTSASDARVAISSGSMYDEDIKISINHSVLPSEIFQQFLTPNIRCRQLYRKSNYWTDSVVQDDLVSVGTNRMKYNADTGGGVWDLIEATADNKFIACWLVATNDIRSPIVVIPGQRQDATLEDAISNNTFETLNYGVLPFVEFRSLYRIIFETSSTYSNSSKAALREVTDVRNVSYLQVSSIATADHGTLSGLMDDSHTQYVTKDVARTITAQHTFEPSANGSPFILGTHAQGQKVVGLNADLLDGFDSASFRLAADSYTKTEVTDAIAASALADIITPSTSTKVTYNAKGLVTAGASLVAADIPPLDWSKITTGKPTTLSGYGITDLQDLVAAQLRRTTTQALTTTAVDITFNTVDFANNTAVLVQGATTSQLIAKVAGTYQVSFECETINTTTANLDRFQIKKNGVNLPQGLATVNCRSTRQRVTIKVVLTLAANDYITVAASSNTGTTGTMQIGASLTGIRLQGLQGPTGAPGGQSSILYSAANLDNPTNANWAVNALAPAAADTLNAALTIRAFDDTLEEGVGATIYIPPAVTSLVLTVTGKCATAPASNMGVIPKLYTRSINTGAPVGTWSAGQLLNTWVIPTNTNFQSYSQSITLASLGLTEGNSAQLELTRIGSSGSDTLVGDFHLLNLTVSFT